MVGNSQIHSEASRLRNNFMFGIRGPRLSESCMFAYPMLVKACADETTGTACIKKDKDKDKDEETEVESDEESLKKRKLSTDGDTREAAALKSKTAKAQKKRRSEKSKQKISYRSMGVASFSVVV